MTIVTFVYSLSASVHCLQHSRVINMGLICEETLFALHTGYSVQTKVDYTYGSMGLCGYLGKQLRDSTPSLVWLVGDPPEDGLKHCAFSSHIEVVILNDGRQLLHGELQDVLRDSDDPIKVLQDEEEDLVSQLRQVVEVHQPPDADAVPQAQLVLQEKAAPLNNPGDQELVCCCQNLQHVVLGHINILSVGVINDEAHHRGRHPGDIVQLLFCDGPGTGEESAVGSRFRGLEKHNVTSGPFGPNVKDSPEVLAGAAQNDLVGVECGAPDLDHHVAQFLPLEESFHR